MLTSNCMCRPYIDTNNPQGMQLGRFKNRTPARFEYIYCTLFPLSLSFKLGHVSIPKRRIFLPLYLFCAYDNSVLQNVKIFKHIYCQISCIRTHGWRKWRTTALTSTIGSEKFHLKKKWKSTGKKDGKCFITSCTRKASHWYFKRYGLKK